MSLLMRIQSEYPTFTVSEKEIADYILSSPKEASRLTIQAMASKIRVSNATITRFSKKIGCKNFSELKLQLASGSELVENNYDDSSLLMKYQEILRDLNGMNDYNEIKNILTMILKAKRIYIYGVGSSGLAAQELNYRLSRMGFTCEAVIDTHLMVIRSSLLKKDDLLLAFSRSGETQELVISVTKAQENGAKIVSVTSSEDTRLTKVSNLTLKNIHPSRSVFMSTGLDMGTLYLIDLISLELLKDPEIFKTYEKTISIISSKAHLK